MKSAFQQLDAQMQAASTFVVGHPGDISFHEFMHKHARVKVDGDFRPYTTEGREPLLFAIAVLDYVLGNDVSYLSVELRMILFESADFGAVIEDAVVDLCGGAQFGKTVLALHFKDYLAAVKGDQSYYVLPDDDLVQGVVDGKERPEVLDQIPWLAQMSQIGKALTESGKSVNRKGAMLFTDGKRAAMSYTRGMGKVPTTFSADCVIEDEKDDIKEQNAKFLKGRMTASKLRLHLRIGTQRFHGAGQNKCFEEGAQIVELLTCTCGDKICPEEQWPQVARIALDGRPQPSDPCLTWEGDFKHPGRQETVATFDHEAHYYFACPSCGAELNRESTLPLARQPGRIRARHWSLRVAQLSCSGLSVKMFVADWCQNAVRDTESMIAFCCDRLAMPKSMDQAITPAILDRARSLEEYDLSLSLPKAGVVRVGGMDTGDRCWFYAREIESPSIKRTQWAEQVSPERARSRIPQLFTTLGLSCLFIDIGAERNLARDLCMILNGLANWEHPRIPEPEKTYITFPGGMAWDGPNGRWRGVKCATVEFTLKEGQGVRHKLGVTQEGRFYPIIACNRDETMQQAINEFLTAEEGVIEVIAGKLRTAPVMRLPTKRPGAPAIVETIERHILAGSRKEKNADGKTKSFVDKIENHLLLANAYSGLAEREGAAAQAAPFEWQGMGDEHPYANHNERGVLI